MGIEPTSLPWQGSILPLNDTCKDKLEWITRIELVPSAWKADILPLNYIHIKEYVCGTYEPIIFYKGYATSLMAENIDL